MSQRRLLLLDAAGLTAFRWSGDRLLPEERFAASSDGIQAFSRFAATHRNTVFTFVADTGDEAVQFETVPFVRGPDRSALIQRRLTQYFFGTPYSTSISLGRDPEGRRDERVLFAALTAPLELEPWLTALRQEGGRLSGLYSIAQAIPGLLQRLKLSPQRRLVLTVGPRGVRQTFIDGGQLRLSRLTPLAAGTPLEAATVCATEAGKLYNYLSSQRLIERGAALPTTIVANPELIPTLAAACRNRPELVIESLALDGTSQRYFNDLPTDHALDALVVHSLIARPPREQFAPAEDRHAYRVGQIGQGLRAAGLLVLLGCLLLSGKIAYEISTQREQISEARMDTAADRNRYASAMASLPSLPLPADRLSALSARYSAMLHQSPAVADTLRQISSALDTQPAIELDSLDWRIAERPDSDSSALPQSATGPAGVPAVAPLPSFQVIITDIEGHLPMAWARDNRKLLAEVDAFVAQLRTVTGGEVSAVKLPFDAESGKRLRSDDHPGDSPAAPSFKIHIVQRLP